MANLCFQVVALAISLVGATIISWPILTRTKEDVAEVAATIYGGNPNLRTMLLRERNFARVGLGLVLAGSSLQFVAATL